ncbi:MAG: thioredoxin family protein [Anaerolineae bacterium]
MSILIRVFNHRFYPVMIGFVLLASAFLLAQDGTSLLDIGVLTGILVAAGGGWLLLRSTQTEGQDTVERFKQNIAASGKPTIVQFFSQYCVGCLAVKPVVDQLENEAGDRLQIIRLSIDEEPGRSLVEEYDVVYTPTFVYFDAQGNKLRDSTFILDRARVLYELEQA